MEPQGYRRQQEEEVTATPAESRVTSSVSSVLVGIAAVVVTVVALFVLVRVMSGGPTVAQGPDPGTPGQPGAGVAAGGEDLGSKDAPIQVKGFPGHCEDHMKVCAALRTLAKEHPDAIHVTLGEMQGPEASKLGLTCASYVMKFDRFAELDYKSEGQTTDGDYEILATKSPSGGASWTADQLEALFRKAIDLVEAKSADKAAPGSEAKPDAPADGAKAKAPDEKGDKSAPDPAKGADPASAAKAPAQGAG